MNSQLDTFILLLKRKRITGSFNVSKATAEFLRHYTSMNRWTNAKSLIEQVKTIGKRLIETQPLEFCIGNIVRRVLFIIREEYVALKKEKVFTNLKSAILESIGELIDELKGLHKSISEQCTEHIHANEVIMTLGCSKTVEEFLKEAGRKRKFGVIVVETAPTLEGHQTALNLSLAGIDTTLIGDNSIFAMMSRCNKVIIGTHAVMANGGLIATSGTHMLTVAAKYHSVPVMVCAGLYKLCPLYAYDQDTYNDFGSPSAYLKFKEAEFLEQEYYYPEDTLEEGDE
eukprot:gene6726-7819_t